MFEILTRGILIHFEVKCVKNEGYNWKTLNFRECDLDFDLWPILKFQGYSKAPSKDSG